MKTYTIGIDFGTLSGRCVLVDCGNGQEVAEAVCNYAHGVMDDCLPSGKKLPPVYLSCGTADGLYADNVAYRAHLEKLGYTVTWDEDGSGHEWGFWNRQVGKFIEELVK